MKKYIAMAILLLGCLCVAQNSEADFPAGLRIFFSDGTDIMLACEQDGNCRIMKNRSNVSITRINLGFKAKHGYTLLVQ